MKCLFLVLSWIHAFLCFLIFIQLFALVLCPLSVTDGWALEVFKFVPSLEVLQYVGDKEHRHSLRRTLYEYVKEQSLSYNISYNFGRSSASGPGNLGGEWLCKGVRDLKKKI
jgi:hypothetical protein